MNKTILKKFAIESRQDLMQKMKNQIKMFYVDETFSKRQNGDIIILSNDKYTLNLTKEEYNKRELLIKRINELGIEQVIEESAYTWFNRIIAIRYMEINDYLPLTKDNQSLGIRVLSSKDNTPDPEIMKFTNLTNPDLDINFKKEKYIELKDDNEKFKYILILICKKLGKVIPPVFDGVTDYIDILTPDNLLNDTGFVSKIVKEIPEDYYNQVEIIGWLYQYYNQTEKDRVISAKKAYKKNEIPYATQLFTPAWIVKYMVENSLGRYWIENRGDKKLIDNWKYFIKDNLNIKSNKKRVQDVNDMTVNEVNNILVDELSEIKPTDITFIDPCSGSGNILVYALEVLYQIYESYGYNKSDIPELILKNNLYGLDIDDRANQLSILSVLLKAREYDKNIFNKEITKNLNIMSIQETGSYDIAMLDELTENSRAQAEYLLDNFKYGKEIGSLLILEKNNYNNLENEINNNMTIFGEMLRNKISPLIKVAKILTKKYDIVVTNPPYLNNSVMNNKLKEYVNKNYKAVKSDMFSAFILRNSVFGEKRSYLGYMTPYVWMFISSYKELRKYIIENLNISSLIQLEYSALEEATVPICTFVLKNDNDKSLGTYFRLTDFTGGMKVQGLKFLEALNRKTDYVYSANTDSFNKIPGSPIGYWVSDKLIEVFDNSKLLSEVCKPTQGLATADNNRFLRQWFEVGYDTIKFNAKNSEVALKSKKKWFPYNKGGEFRKWYGNNDYVVNWENDGFEIKHFYDNKGKQRSVVRNPNYYFKESATWTLISSSSTSFRYKPYGFIFDVAGMSFFNENNLFYYLAFCNTKVANNLLKIIAPTLNYQVGDISKLPIIYDSLKKDIIEKLVNENLSISKQDWDSFETSWDFKKHPLLEFIDSIPGYYDHNVEVPISRLKSTKNNYGELCYTVDKAPIKAKMEDSFNGWNEFTLKQFNKLKQNEEKLNRIFIDIYGLQDELTPEVEDKNVTIRKADRLRDIKSLISYAVGCMFGRYSLDQEGLVYAGGEFDSSKYKTFKADADNIIPITDDAYFEDDIVSKFKKFIEIVYGKETLNENLDFIAETLCKKGTETSEETIRRYFLNDFFNDHVKTYQKRPIYWLFDSGKKNGFKALIYMHRYNENTVPKVRLDYLHRIQNTYDKLLKDVNYKLTTELPINEKKETQKKQADLNAKLQEINEYDEKIAHIANQRINIDLDDGVVVNYAKFQDILAKIK